MEYQYLMFVTSSCLGEITNHIGWYHNIDIRLNTCHIIESIRATLCKKDRKSTCKKSVKRR